MQQKRNIKMINREAYDRLVENGIRPSAQRLSIMDWLMKHPVHPTIDDVYNALVKEIPTLSKTTVYNTLRLLSENHAAQMLTIDDHHVCYDGNTQGHVHFYCRHCGKVYDLMEEDAPALYEQKVVSGHLIQEEQLYYKGICKDCLKLEQAKES